MKREEHIVDSKGNVIAGPFDSFGQAMAAAKNLGRKSLRLRITDERGQKFVRIPD